MRCTSTLGIDRFVEECIGKKIIEITTDYISYDDTVSTIELTYTSDNGIEPHITLMDEDLTPLPQQEAESKSIIDIIKDLWYN